MLLEINLGPFAPVFGYAGAILGAVYGIWALIWGRKGVWETPQDIIPKTIRGIVGIILGIGMVFLWLDINPKSLYSKISLAFILAGVALFAFVLYIALLRVLTYDKQVAISSRKTKAIKVIGGLWLRESAKNIMNERDVRTVQELLNGSNHVDELWSRFSQELSKSFIVILYLFIVVCGTLGLTTAGFIVQAGLSHKTRLSFKKSISSCARSANC